MLVHSSNGSVRVSVAAGNDNIEIVGGGAFPPISTFMEYVVIERDEVIPTPDCLDGVQAAAWPMAAVTGWRYVSGHSSDIHDR